MKEGFSLTHLRKLTKTHRGPEDKLILLELFSDAWEAHATLDAKQKSSSSHLYRTLKHFGDNSLVFPANNVQKADRNSKQFWSGLHLFSSYYRSQVAPKTSVIICYMC